ncbi:MAG: YeeE/YedE family protein, partial [Saprospiraceae bacterium]|nr:YeeE/YedE family protein [Saprospiraceae bacterium]
MIEFVRQPWPWYVGGPMIALVLFLLLHAGKRFGVSTSLETFCTIGGAGRFVNYFKADWRKRSWLMLFVAGSIIGGFITVQLLQNPDPINLSVATISDLAALGITYD